MADLTPFLINAALSEERREHAVDLIVRALRDDRPLDMTTRKLLADLLDHDSGASHRFDLKKRKRGRPRSSQWFNIGQAVEALEYEGVPTEAAVSEVAQAFGSAKPMSRSTVYEAKRVYAQAQREEYVEEVGEDI